MTTATRKTKTVDTKLPLLQQGDRITGLSRRGTTYTGAFVRHSDRDWIICDLGTGKQVALNPATVERTAPEPELADICEEEEAVARACGALPDPWQPQEGDRVRGKRHSDGETVEGVITNLGHTYAALNNSRLNNSRHCYITLSTVELLQPQAIPDDLLHLAGLPWSEQVDVIFGDRGISNLANFIDTKPDLNFFESWRGWIISFHNAIEVHLCKAGQAHSWFFALSKHPKLKGNGDISQFCHEAIDEVEDAIATVEAGMGSQESVNTLVELPHESETAIAIDQATFDQFAETYSADLLSNDRIRGTFHWQEQEFVCAGKHLNSQHHPDSLRAVEVVAPEKWGTKLYNYWDLCAKKPFSHVGQLVRCKQRKLVLTDRELHFAVAPTQAEWVDEAETPMQSLGALLPTVEATIALTHLETLAAEVEAIFAEAEEAEATMLNAGRAAFTRSLALGEKLLAAKAEPSIGGYGKWLPWLEARGIPERKAQRAIRLYSHRQLLEQSDAATELTLTEALDLVSKKSLKPALEIPIAAQTPETIEQKYALTGDHATPTLEELMLLYAQIGRVKPWRKGFAIEREDIGNPFPLALQNRASAWKRWQETWRSFAATHPLPATETPTDVQTVVSEKIDGLEGKNQGIDPYEYEPISPQPVWFDPGDGTVEGTAIATNGKGFVRINWDGRQSDVPSDRVSWATPTVAEFEPVPEFDTQNSEFNTQNSNRSVLPNGLVEHRPACSRWEPEEVAAVARIQLQGLLKHLSPSELVKAAIVHSGVSLPDVVRMVVQMANNHEYKGILEVFSEDDC